MTNRRERWVPLALLLAAVIVPNWSVAAMRSVLISDDGFISDIANGEFPGRLAVAASFGDHEPFWYPHIYGGFDLSAFAYDPFGLIYRVLPPLYALNLHILLLLSLTALGTYAFARAIGATRVGSSLAGAAFVWSGFVVCQMKHLAILTVVLYFPWCLLALARALDPRRRERRWAPLFGLLYGGAALAAFPQTLYIQTLVLVAAALTALAHARSSGRWVAEVVPRYATLLLGGALGVGLGFVSLYVMRSVVPHADRPLEAPWRLATRWVFDLPNLINFVIPFGNGDISDDSYRGPGIFWEDYAYAGLFTLLLAGYAVFLSFRRGGLGDEGPSEETSALPPRVWIRFWAVTALVCLLVALGTHTPLFGLLFRYLPGMSSFRLPTRFLVVVDFAICVLAAFGADALIRRAVEALERRRAEPSRGAGASALTIGVTLWVLAVADVCFWNSQVNLWTDAARWLSPPGTARHLREHHPGERYYAALTVPAHYNASAVSRATQSAAPYFELRALLQPNINVLWGLSSAGGYSGISYRWSGFLFGELAGGGAIGTQMRDGLRSPRALGEALQMLRASSVRHVLSPAPYAHPALRLEAQLDGVYVYELRDPAPPFYLVDGASGCGGTDAECLAMLQRPEFDVASTAMIHGEPRELVAVMEQTFRRLAQPSAPDRAHVEGTSARRLRVQVETRGRWLVSTETFSPDARAYIDGAPVPCLRANVHNRAVFVPRGVHEVRFETRLRAHRTGRWVSLGALVVLLGWASLALRRDRAGSR